MPRSDYSSVRGRHTAPAELPLGLVPTEDLEPPQAAEGWFAARGLNWRARWFRRVRLRCAGVLLLSRDAEVIAQGLPHGGGVESQHLTYVEKSEGPGAIVVQEPITRLAELATTSRPAVRGSSRQHDANGVLKDGARQANFGAGANYRKLPDWCEIISGSS
jgi:hypothetical protein